MYSDSRPTCAALLETRRALALEAPAGVGAGSVSANAGLATLVNILAAAAGAVQTEAGAAAAAEGAVRVDAGPALARLHQHQTLIEVLPGPSAAQSQWAESSKFLW